MSPYTRILKLVLLKEENIKKLSYKKTTAETKTYFLHQNKALLSEYN